MPFRFIAPLALIALVAAGLWFLYSGPKPIPAPAGPPPNSGAPFAPAPAPISPVQPPAPERPPPGGCDAATAFEAAARANADSVRNRLAGPMGRQETGWEIYAPLAAHEVGAPCPPDSPGFAEALSRWQAAHKLKPTGEMDETTLDGLRLAWHARRPFVAATRHGKCPAAPDEAFLAAAAKAEGYSGKPILLRQGALDAYRRLVAAARADIPDIAADPRLLTIFSGFRGPVEEAARCTDGGCSTPARATCSAHRTGMAVDLYLGAAPGSRPESSDDANRLYQSRTPAYRWLVDNAARFGFFPYAFEPWHWEWTGEAP